MEADAHRLDEGGIARRDAIGRNHLLPRYDDVVGHGTVALHSECLVELAGIHATGQTRGACTAVRVGVNRNGLAYGERCGNAFAQSRNLATNLMTRDDGELHHWVTTEIGIQVRAAIADVTHLDKHFACLGFGLLHLDNAHLGGSDNLYCFHVVMLFCCYSDMFLM